MNSGLENARRTPRIGIEGYVRILAMLRKPMTSQQVIDAIGLDRIAANRILRHMRKAGLIHREQWFRPHKNSRMLPMWAIGSDGDVPNPGYECPTRVPPSQTLLTLLTVIEVMREEPRPMKELAAEVGMHPFNVSRVVKFLRQHKLSRIHQWIRQPKGPPYPVHAYCEKWTPDAKRPTRECLKTQNKRWKTTFFAKAKHLAMLQALSGSLPAANEARRAA